MPRRRLPNTTPAVLRTFKAAHDTYLLTTVPADRAIGTALFAQLDLSDAGSLYFRFLKEASEVDIAIAAQAPRSSDLAQKAAQLTMLVSHFHQVLDLGITRGAFAVGARSYYGRDITSTKLPDLSSYAAVAEAAQHVVDGEGSRLTAESGTYVAMALPSASEVGDALVAFKAARGLSQVALTKTDAEREDVSTLYPAAQALAVDLCDTVEFFYRKDPEAASRREKCRRWGVVYIPDPGETPEPEPAPTPVVPTP